MSFTTFYTVYKTTNTINGHYYIGVHKTTNPNDSYLGSGVHLKDAIKLYGRQAFVKEVLFMFETIDEAYKKERELVNEELVASPETYNLTLGGTKSVDWVEERRQIHKKNIAGENHPFFGKKHTVESNAKRSATLKANPNRRSAESYKAQGDRRRGYVSTLRGIPQSRESNEKRSAAHLTLQKLKCPHCGKESEPGNAKRWHFDNCKLVEARIVPQIECPHCGTIGNRAAMYRWHFDHCKKRVS